MDAENIDIECDEDGFWLVFDAYEYGEDGKWKEWESHSFRVKDPEHFYDRVKAVIGPWLQERDAARSSLPPTWGMTDEMFESYISDAYADDPGKREGMRQARAKGYA